jgi:hypothetical protein
LVSVYTKLFTPIRAECEYQRLPKQVLRASNAIREEVDELDAVGAGFLAIWLVLTLISAFAFLAYSAVS